MTWRRHHDGHWELGRARLHRSEATCIVSAGWVAELGGASSIASTVAQALSDVAAPPCPVCSCGWPLVRPGVRARELGAVLEYCDCSRPGCLSTTCVRVEECGHARVVRWSADDRWSESSCRCVDCGHEWTERPDCVTV